MNQLQRYVNDWKEIADAYDRSYEEGFERQNKQQGICELCAEYKKTIPCGDYEYLSCPCCPVKLHFGHVCGYMWAKHGILTDDKYDREKAGISARKTYELLKGAVKNG